MCCNNIQLDVQCLGFGRSLHMSNTQSCRQVRRVNAVLTRGKARVAIGINPAPSLSLAP